MHSEVREGEGGKWVDLVWFVIELNTGQYCHLYLPYFHIHNCFSTILLPKIKICFKHVYKKHILV